MTQGNRGTHAALVPIRSHHGHLAEFLQLLSQHPKPLGIDTIIVAYEYVQVTIQSKKPSEFTITPYVEQN
jgi:hypothetical protein